MTFIILAEPVNIKDLGRLIGIKCFTDLDPVFPVIAHIIAAERKHSHGIAANNAYCAGCGGSCFRAHDGTDEHTVIPAC